MLHLKIILLQRVCRGRGFPGSKQEEGKKKFKAHYQLNWPGKTGPRRLLLVTSVVSRILPFPVRNSYFPSGFGCVPRPKGILQTSLGVGYAGPIQEVGEGCILPAWKASPLCLKKRRRGRQLSVFASALGPATLAPFQTVAASLAPTLKGLRCFA